MTTLPICSGAGSSIRMNRNAAKSAPNAMHSGRFADFSGSSVHTGDQVKDRLGFLDGDGARGGVRCAVGRGDLQDHGRGADCGGRCGDGVDIVRAVAGAHRLAERDDAAVSRVDLHGVLQAVEVLSADVEGDRAGFCAVEVERGGVGLGLDAVHARGCLDGDLAIKRISSLRMTPCSISLSTEPASNSSLVYLSFSQ